MSLDELKNQKDKEEVPTPDEIWKLLRTGEEIQNETKRLFQQWAIESKEEAKRNQLAFKEEMKQSDIKFKEEMKQNQINFKEEMKQDQINFKKEMRERQVKFEAEMAQRQKASEKELKKFRGIWSNAWGDFVESLVSGQFVELIQDWIPSINLITKNMKSERHGRECEVDIVAINSDSLVATEVKSTLTVRDVREFLEKLKVFNLSFPQFKKYKIYGAVAYLKANQDAHTFAMKNGLFVIRATGDSGKILNKKGHFIPQVIEQASQFPTK